MDGALNVSQTFPKHQNHVVIWHIKQADRPTKIIKRKLAKIKKIPEKIFSETIQEQYQPSSNPTQIETKKISSPPVTPPSVENSQRNVDDIFGSDSPFAKRDWFKIIQAQMNVKD